MMRRQLVTFLAAAWPMTAVARPANAGEKQFAALLERLAANWNAGDAQAAAACFTADAVYVEPPRKQVYRGRAELYRFFGGDSGRPGAMQMTWRNIVFDAHRQRGMGEFSFRYGTQVHGVAVIALRDGLIDQWREYWYASELPFEQFVAPGAP
jgi:hypothetical protein